MGIITAISLSQGKESPPGNFPSSIYPSPTDLLLWITKRPPEGETLLHQQKKGRNGAFLLIEGVSSSLKSSGVTWGSLLGEGQQRPEKSRFADELEKDALGLFQRRSAHLLWVTKRPHFLAKGGAKRIRIERLPGYAPELNPQEGVWNLLKCVELKNVCCLDLQHIEEQLLHAKERLRHRKGTLSQCYAHAGYAL